MIKKYHNHKLQTNSWHRKEEPHINHEAPARQTKQNNQLSLPNQDDCKLERTEWIVTYNKTLKNYRLPQWE